MKLNLNIFVTTHLIPQILIHKTVHPTDTISLCFLWNLSNFLESGTSSSVWEFRNSRDLVTTEHFWEKKNKPSLWAGPLSRLSSWLGKFSPFGENQSRQSCGLVILEVSRPASFAQKRCWLPGSPGPFEVGVLERMWVYTQVHT